ncbi:Krueppel homolog 1 [Gryllus bimaculatus]|nr:Krueppel homolog 1 [Gryllus bimaculatus]
MPVGHTIDQSLGGDCCKHICEGDISASKLTHPHEKPSCEKCETETSSILPTKNNMDDVLSFECNMCPKKYPRKISLIAHMRHHTKNNPYKCTICLEDFTCRVSLVRHMQIHTREGPHECIKCKRHFSLKSNVVQHMKTCPGLHYCPVCKKKFTKRAEVVRHVASHTTENLHCCTVCQKNFYEKRQLMSHMLIAHPKSEHCSVCKVSIKDGETLEGHMHVHFGKKSYECFVCPQSFKRKYSLAMHMLFHSKETRHKCCICQKGFMERRHLLRHLQTRVHMQHIVDTPLHCYICKKTCRTKGHLRQHVSTHARKIHHKSVTDGVEEVRPTTLSNNEDILQGVVCQNNFSKSKELISHMQDHIQPHHCSICDMKIEDEATFTWHMRTHCGAELYKCPICQSSFAAKERSMLGSGRANVPSAKGPFHVFPGGVHICKLTLEKDITNVPSVRKALLTGGHYLSMCGNISKKKKQNGNNNETMCHISGIIGIECMELNEINGISVNTNICLLKPNASAINEKSWEYGAVIICFRLVHLLEHRRDSEDEDNVLPNNNNGPDVLPGDEAMSVDDIYLEEFPNLE